MKRLWPMLFLTGCTYTLDDIKMGLGFMAKETCSCVYVSKQPDEFCRAYGDLNAIPVKISVNRADQSANAEFLWFWSRHAYLVSESEGCRLESDNEK